jgi:hypothetical protein
MHHEEAFQGRFGDCYFSVFLLFGQNNPATGGANEMAGLRASAPARQYEHLQHGLVTMPLKDAIIRKAKIKPI